MKKKYHKSQLSIESIKENTNVPIVSDAAIATTVVGEGRFIPLIIIDTSNHKNIDDLVNIHKTLPPGDVEICWGWPQGSNDIISLILNFKKPIVATIHLNFDVMTRGGLVDLIINSKALYLQPGRQGDRLMTTMNNPRILVEIPDTDFGEMWLDKWKKTTFKKLRNQGLSRTEARNASQKIIDEWRETMKFHIK